MRNLLELYVLAPWRAVAAIAAVALLGVPGVVGGVAAAWAWTKADEP